jgi:hypothetical protein
MSPLEQSQIRTRMFARMLGPFCAIVPTTVAIRGSYMQTLFTEFKANPMWPWLFGAILLMFGLVIIAFHQYWRSPEAIIVSACGLVSRYTRRVAADRSTRLQRGRERHL